MHSTRCNLFLYSQQMEHNITRVVESFSHNPLHSFCFLHLDWYVLRTLGFQSHAEAARLNQSQSGSFLDWLAETAAATNWKWSFRFELICWLIKVTGRSMRIRTRSTVSAQHITHWDRSLKCISRLPTLAWFLLRLNSMSPGPGQRQTRSACLWFVQRSSAGFLQGCLLKASCSVWCTLLTGGSTNR